MNDLLASLGSATQDSSIPSLPIQNLLRFETFPAIDLSTDHSQGPHTRPNHVSAKHDTPSHLMGAAQDYLSSPNLVEEQHEEEFGDFQEPVGTQDASLQTLPTQALDDFGFRSIAPTTELLDGILEDDFGDFVDSPSLTANTFETHNHAKESSSLPLPGQVLEFMLASVLRVPSDFIAELASLPYPLKKAVLSSSRTKRWLDSMSEAAVVAQRVISGRNRRIKDEKSRRDVQVVSVKVAQEWEHSLLPRLLSLSGGTLRLHKLRTNPFNDNYDLDNTCRICGTEAESASPLQPSWSGGLAHRSCESLAQAMKHTPSLL